MVVAVYSESSLIFEQMKGDDLLLAEADSFVETGLLGVESTITLEDGTEVVRRTTVLEVIILSVNTSMATLGDQILSSLRGEIEEDEEEEVVVEGTGAGAALDESMHPVGDGASDRPGAAPDKGGPGSTETNTALAPEGSQGAKSSSPFVFPLFVLVHTVAPLHH